MHMCESGPVFVFDLLQLAEGYLAEYVEPQRVQLF